jgi:hypothetical protein
LSLLILPAGLVAVRSEGGKTQHVQLTFLSLKLLSRLRK